MPDLIPVGRILRPHGVRGELVVEPLNTTVAVLDEVAIIYLGAPPAAFVLESARRHRDRVLIRLENYYNRDSVEGFRGQLVQVAPADLPNTRQGEYSPYQIVGLSVVTDQGEVLGDVVDVIKTGANDVYVVRGPAGEVLLPVIPDVLLAVDLAAGQIKVHLLDGLR